MNKFIEKKQDDDNRKITSWRAPDVKKFDGETRREAAEEAVIRLRSQEEMGDCLAAGAEGGKQRPLQIASSTA